MKTILIVGANGFTGRRLLSEVTANPTYAVTGCSLRADILPADGYRFVRADIRDAAAVTALFERERPQVVINTAALSVPDYCERHHEEARLTNVCAVEHLARACQQYGSRFIHFSTDFVFDGCTEGLYRETDEPNPVNFYGITKLEAERQVAELCNDYAIVRVVVVYGEAVEGQHGNIVQLVANKLRAGEPIRVVNDQWRTPTFVGDVAKGVMRLADHPVNGIYHLCGGECLTIADIAYRVADVLQLDRRLIHPVSTAEMQEATPRPRFSGLSVAKAQRELGYEPIGLDAGIRQCFG
ncbi:MAG: dTDP-4-dehydrorhamnose reductase [Bacteroides sp.]